MTNDMTKGAITPLLIRFTIPLVLGNLFQLTYNAADSIIVGKFVGEEALAAVGTSNPLMTLAILFINGMCLGAGILVSTAFGAGDTQLMERQVSTTAIAGTVFSLAFSALCVILATPLLQLMQVPADILPIAVSYLRIVFAGLIFTFFYNFLAATMRALGDSKSALYFLMISSVLNIGGDLFFVQVLNWGSNGCALSTVVSEALCCVLCVLYIRWKVPILQLGRRWLVFDGKLLRKTVSYGWASAMQQATVQLGKIAVQAIVNTMGVNAMAAFTAASRIDDFAYTPQQNIGHAMTTLMAQNRGAGKHDRVKQGFHCGMRIEAAYGVLIAVVCFAGAPFIMKLFVTDPGCALPAHGFPVLPDARSHQWHSGLLPRHWRSEGHAGVQHLQHGVPCGGSCGVRAGVENGDRSTALQLCGGLGRHAALRAAHAVSAQPWRRVMIVLLDL